MVTNKAGFAGESDILAKELSDGLAVQQKACLTDKSVDCQSRMTSPIQGVTQKSSPVAQRCR